MDVDLDRYTGPSADPALWAERREALLDQLAWLVDEATALEPLLASLPAWALEQTPLPGERSVKETLADLAARDQLLHGGWIEQVTAENDATLRAEAPRPQIDANERPLNELLKEVRSARTALLDTLRALPVAGWHRTAALEGAPVSVFDLALQIARHDADRLRDLAYRLHTSKLTERPQDLPK